MTVQEEGALQGSIRAPDCSFWGKYPKIILLARFHLLQIGPGAFSLFQAGLQQLYSVLRWQGQAAIGAGLHVKYQTVSRAAQEHQLFLIGGGW